MEGFEGAVEALKAGRAVVFPTDTVYGLGVAVRYAATPTEIYTLKQRDADKPIAWLVGSIDDLLRYGADIPEHAIRRAREEWPGALTLVVNASDEVPPAYRSKRGTVGLRMPADETALTLIREVGPLATSSANLSIEPATCRLSRISPKVLQCAAAVIQDDEAGHGISSTVIDYTQEDMKVIRNERGSHD